MTQLHRLASALLAALGIAGCGGGTAEDAGFESIAGESDIVVPTAVATPLRFTDLAVGLHHGCGLTAGGAIHCWGSNEYGQLGSIAPMAMCSGGSTPCSSTPVPVASTATFSGLAASLRSSCVVTAAGAAWCWGFGVGGQLGDGLSTSSGIPVQVAGPDPFRLVALGGSGLISCGVATTGAGFCWGPGGGGGGLGDGTTGGANAPVAIAGGLVFTALAVGDDHACGLAGGGATYCWGQNFVGELGDRTHTDRVEPVAVATSLRFVAIRAGASTCALDSRGQVYCWGSNLFGQSGQPP